jgi:hypothetical protein
MGQNDFNGEYANIFKKKTFFCPNLKTFVYFIPTKTPFIPCYMPNENLLKCPDNFTSSDGFFPNCLQICEYSQ